MCSITCPVCREAAGDVLAVCSGCETPHHPECWEFAGGCAVFACGQDRARLVSRADLVAALTHPRSEPLYVDEGTPEPETIRLADLEELPRRPLPRRDSDPVMFVSWVYLAASLILAIPTLGCVVGGVTGLRPGQLVHAGCFGALALCLKHVGDLIAIGDPRGRTAHLYGCLGLGLASVSLIASLSLLLLAAPFWTHRGRRHFSRWVD